MITLILNLTNRKSCLNALLIFDFKMFLKTKSLFSNNQSNKAITLLHDLVYFALWIEPGRKGIFTPFRY